MNCAHGHIEPVHSLAGELVARICVDCLDQLPARGPISPPRPPDPFKRARR